MTSSPGSTRAATSPRRRDGRAWLAAMLDVEAALARACAAEGLIPEASARAIAEACRAERFDLAAIAAAAAESATPVIALVAALREAVGEEVAPHVHLGATSQDIVDTAAMLLAQRALEPLLADAGAAIAAAAGLARAHRDTLMAARTLLQQAEVTTFGLRAAGWMVGLDEAARRLRELGATRLAVQMGGPVGTRAPAVAGRVAAELGLADPVLPWGAIRVRPAELAAALGVLAGVCAKIARDVTLLSQTEVGELREGGGPGRGGSSAMPHKRNPVASVSILAAATPRARAGRDDARGDAPGARARRRRLAGRMGDAERAPDADRLRDGVERRAARPGSRSTASACASTPPHSTAHSTPSTELIERALASSAA